MFKLALSEMLKRRNRSIYWLAEETGVSYRHLHRMATKEVKKVDLEIMDKICRALGCEIQDLLVRTEGGSKNSHS